MTTLQLKSIFDFAHPEASLQRAFAVLNSEEATHFSQIELKTQIARCYAEAGEPLKAFEVLNTLKHILFQATPREKALHALEFGRTHDKISLGGEQALRQYKQAIEIATPAKEDDIVIEAMHRMSIMADLDDAIALQKDAISLASTTRHPEGAQWLGLLCYNQGWSLYEAEQPRAALSMFEKSLRVRLERQEKKEDILTSKWAIAMMMRVLGRPEDALKQQLEVARQSDEEDAYTFAEIVRCLVDLNRQDEATPYAHKAIELLKQEEWPDDDLIEELEPFAL